MSKTIESKFILPTDFAVATDEFIEWHRKALSNASDNLANSIDNIYGESQLRAAAITIPAMIHPDGKVRKASSNAAVKLAKYQSEWPASLHWKPSTNTTLHKKITNMVTGAGGYLSEHDRDRFQELRAANIAACSAYETELTKPVHIDNTTMSRSDYTAALMSPDAQQRLAAYTANTTRISATQLENLQTIIDTNDQCAKLLGFNNHAESIHKLAPTILSPASAMSFLQALHKSIAPKAAIFHELLTGLAKADGLDELRACDVAYYTNRVAPKPTFNLNGPTGVINVVMAIYADEFDLSYEKAELADYGLEWLPDTVFVYRVSRLGRPLGAVVFDLFSRPGKFSHFAMFTVTPRTTTCLPLVLVVGNFLQSPTYQQTRTFFHEYGHVIDELLSDTAETLLAGISREHDFMEAPSQMFERWFLEPKVLKKLGVNEPILTPESAYEYLPRISMAMFDMCIATGSTDIVAVWNECHKLTLLPPTKGYLLFGHLSHGYSARYYGYCFSAALAASMYSTMKQLGNNGASRLVEALFSRGSSRPAIESVLEFGNIDWTALTRELKVAPIDWSPTKISE